MDASRMLEELEGACERLRAAVVYAELTGEGMSTGGLCKVRGEWRVIVEKRASHGEKVSVLARAVAELGAEDVYLSPEARDVVARYGRDVGTRHAPEAARGSAGEEPAAPARAGDGAT